MSTLLKVRPVVNLTDSPRPATLVDWISYPERLSIEQAAFLVGQPEDQIEEWIETGAVDSWDDTDGSTQVDKASLREFWELVWEIGDYYPPA